MGFELTTLVVIGTDCTGSCISNYHMITTTSVPLINDDLKTGIMYVAGQACLLEAPNLTDSCSWSSFYSHTYEIRSSFRHDSIRENTMLIR